jgi:MFS family permease
MLEMKGMLKDLSLFGIPLTGWRLAFLFGTIPAAIALLVRRKLKEPERWAETSAQKRGSYAELFGTPRWRYNALIGLVIGFAAVVGLWGIGFFGVQLAMSVITDDLKAEGFAGQELSGRVKIWGGLYSFFLNLGAAGGMILFGYLAQRLNRRIAFFLAFTVAMITTAATFWNYSHSSQTFWLTPIMGFCLLSVFAVLAIYFPELFPTRLRSTGTSFCYNVGRFVAASGPYIFGFLVSGVFSVEAGYTKIEGLRYAGVVMCSVFLIGIAILPFAPETKGKPLPE